MKKFSKLSVFVLLAVCVCMISAFTVGAAKLSDIEKHWAKEYIEYGVEKGYISGYEDGTFLPDKTVSRAEFSKMINSAIKLTSVGDAKAEFKDVKSNDWFFNEVKKAENAGYITGYAEDGTFRPNNPVTRQEAAVILSRLVLPIVERANINSFNDGDKIDTWAVDAVTMIAAKGYIKGDENKNFNSKGSLTRSQAAKLICEFVKNENLVNKNQGVDVAGKDMVFSETLFTDDVVITYSGEEPVTVTFANSRVLGNVIVKSENVFVKFENSAAKKLTVDAEDVVVSLDKTSTVKTAAANYPCDLEGKGYDKVVLSGDELLTGSVTVGGCKTLEVGSDAIISAGEVDKLNITDKVNLTIQAGTFKSLTAEAAAKGSSISLSKKVVVEKANNKSAVTYTGSGTIEEAVNDVTGVVFDAGVTVEKTSGKVAEGAGTGVTSGDFFKDVEVNPENGKKNVAISQSISLTFINSVYDKSGEKLTTKYVTDNIKLKKGTASGTDIPFEVSLATSQKKITIKPAANYKNGTKYTLVIPEGVLAYENGAVNGKLETSFTTIAAPNQEVEEDEDTEDKDASVTMSPKNGAEDVAVDESIKLTFSGTLKASSGTLDEDYIEEEAIKIYKDSTSTGDEVNFTASISGKTITLNPSRLLGETKYYVVILGNKLKVGSDTLSKTTLSFTTKEGTAITISPENGATGVSTLPEIVVSFAEPMLQMTREHDALTETYIQDEVLYIKKGSAKDSADDVYYSVTEIAENGKKFVIVPDEELESGTTYYIIIQEGSLYGEETEEENAKITSNFKTASAMAPMFYPLDGKENVSLGTEIRISFSDELLTYAKDKTDRVEVTDDYLDELINGYEDSKGKIQGKNRIMLKRTGSSKPLTITATLDSDGKTIIITPETALIEEKEYTISIEKNLFYSCADGKTYKANTSGSASFNTNVAMAPTITPKNDAEDVAVTVNPTIKFSETILNDEGKELKSTYLKNNAITFVDADGNEVEFKVTISGSVITVEPEEDLEGNTEYTLTLVADTIQNEDGIFNGEKSVTFTTKVSYNIDITPTSAKKHVSPFVNPTVKFGTPVLTEDGKEVDADYAAEYIFLSEKSASKNPDDAIEATIEISADGRTFTIVPDSELDFDIKYYVNVLAKGFLYEDEDTENKAANAYFTTIAEPEIDPGTKKTFAKAGGKTSIKITYVSNVMDDSDDELAILVVEDEGGNEVLTKPITSTSSSTVTVKGLESDTEYTFFVYIRYADEIESEAVEVSAKTNA